MNKKQIIGAIIAAALFVIIGISSVITNTWSQKMLKEDAIGTAKEIIAGSSVITTPLNDYIGVVAVDGVIGAQTQNTSMFEKTAGYQHNTTLEYIDTMMKEDNNKGILLRIDSPGGAVYESEELYLKIREYQEATGRPVWTYMQHYAASGGYYVAAPSDKIYANPNTTTGSIGVVISGYDMSGLYEKLGIKAISVTTGANKDMSSPNEEQLGIYQSIVDESFERFVEIVADGRAMTKEEVKVLADGRIYTAKQAKGNGLIDEISLYEDMQTAMTDETGATQFYEPESPKNIWSTIWSKVETLKPKSEAEILTDIAKEYGSGVPMYYAEQLQ